MRAIGQFPSLPVQLAQDLLFTVSMAERSGARRNIKRLAGKPRNASPPLFVPVKYAISMPPSFLGIRYLPTIRQLCGPHLFSLIDSFLTGLKHSVYIEELALRFS